MADKTLQSLVGGGGGIKFAPDLNFPSSLSPGSGYSQVSGINATGGLTTVLSLSGKFTIDVLWFSSLNAETITIRATLDGELLWDDTFNCTAKIYLLGGLGISSGVSGPISTICEESFTLEIQTTTDPDIDFNYLVRPIL